MKLNFETIGNTMLTSIKHCTRYGSFFIQLVLHLDCKLKVY